MWGRWNLLGKEEQGPERFWVGDGSGELGWAQNEWQ